MSLFRKSDFTAIMIVFTLLGMSLSAIPISKESTELENIETKFSSHTNISIEGYQEDSIYSYSTLSSGGYTQCIITEDNRVACWGNNDQGKRGLGGGIGNADVTPSGKAGPWLVGNLSVGMVEVSAGAWSTCSLKETGQIWCWGGGSYGQLGSGTDVCQDQGSGGISCADASNYPPVQVSLPMGKTAVSLSDANQGHFCAILNTGEGLCWGWNNHGELGDGTVCTGGTYLSDNNNPSPAGCNSQNGRYTPVIVDDSNFPTNSSFISISMGLYHTCGIIDNNDLYCWGYNDNGQLGIGTTDSQNYPTPQFVDSNVIAVSTGDNHACALYESQTIKCWGANTEGQLGTGNMYYQNTPTSINLSSNISLISIESAYNNNCAISEDFIPICWGANQFGQTGNYDEDDIRQENPLPFWQTYPEFSNYTTIAMSINGNTNCQILSQSSDNSTHNHRDVLCHGQAYRGQMGDGNWNDSFSDWNTIFVNLSTDNIGPLTYQGAGAIHISERDIDSDSIIAILDNIPNGCPDGSYDPNYDGSCVITDAGYYSTNLLYHSQIPCDLGTYQPNTGQSSCIDTSPGNFVPGTGASSQQSCPSGTYQPDYSQVSCIDVSPGYESNFESTAQIMCDVGYYQPNTGVENCIATLPGNYVANTGATIQRECNPGTYQPNYGSSSCIDASIGHFVQDNNSVSQEGCSPGNYQPDTGQTSCIDADPGNFVTDYYSSIQTACDLGTYHNIIGSVQESDCQSSDPGHYVDSTGASSQTECLPGSYNPNSGSVTSSDCIVADIGHIVENSASSEQYPCETGYYQPATGQIFCLESTSGSYVSERGSSSVTYCTEGNYQPESGQSECLDADEGFYVQAPRSSSQTPCLAGSYQPETGTTSCILADIGYHVPLDGQSMQTICPAGQYQPQPASSECLTTDPGSYSSVGSTSPSPCLAGSYQEQAGQSGCALADPGYFVSSVASTEQIACSEGKYQSLTGQESCLSADRGHYVDSDAAREQTPCSAGSYQPLMASTACILASENYFVDSPGQSSQTLCPKGESQPDLGQISCILNPEESGNTMVMIGGIAVVAILTGGVLFTVKNNNSKAQKGRKSTKSARTRKRAPPKED
jgi:alpha-tubulin suppressor-like RCC1 family protein